MKKLLIDTDIGDDIDDALALAQALNSPGIEVVGITTAFRNVETRTKMVLQQLLAWGKPEIPVAAGVGRPLLAEADMDFVAPHWNPAIPAAPENCHMHAVDFIIESVRRYPDLAVAAIAPLTNIALAVCKAPDVMCEAEIWLMGGIYSRSFPEWNFKCDPEAAQIVLSRCKNLKVLGLDVTLQCRMTQEEVEAAKDSEDPKEALLYRWTKQWQNSSNHEPILHDPLVIGAIEQPDLVKFETKQIYVELGGIDRGHSRGQSIEFCDPFHNKPPLHPNVQMAVDVDVDGFMKLFAKRVFPNSSRINKKGD